MTFQIGRAKGPDMAQRSCDLLVIGGGLGGLAAAGRGRYLGLDVVVLEKTSYLGGVAAYSGGVVWVGNNHLAARAAHGDSDELSEQYLAFISGEDDNYDRELRTALMRAAPEAIEFYTETLGVPFSMIGRSDQYYPAAPGSLAAGRSLEVALPGAGLGEWRERLRPSPHFKVGLTQREITEAGGKLAAFRDRRELYEARVAEDFLTGGQGLAGGFLKAAVVEGGTTVHLDARVHELSQSGGGVTGAVADVDGETTTFTASRGVLIATGAYGYHPDVARMEGLPSIKEQAPPIIDGDGLRLADPTPAAVTRSGITFTTLGFPSRTATHPGTDVPLYHPVFDTVGYPHCMIVNADGQRFGDESFYGTFINDISTFDAHTKRFPNFPCFLVMDDRYPQRYKLAGLDEWPAAELVRADSLAELAQALGIDTEGLLATVKRFNGFARYGVDEDHHRGTHDFARASYGDPSHTPNPTLGAVETAPFWGVQLEIVGAGIYSMGLPIDRHARVRTRDGDPVPGLYATGNAAAYTEVLHGYEGGLANIRNITYAYLAASHAGQG